MCLFSVHSVTGSKEERCNKFKKNPLNSMEVGCIWYRCCCPWTLRVLKSHFRVLSHPPKKVGVNEWVFLSQLSLIVKTVVDHHHHRYHHHHQIFITPPGKGAEYCEQFVCLSVCLSASISLEQLYRAVFRSLRKLLCRSPVAVARSCSGGAAIC